MGYQTETYDVISKRLGDWLEATGGEIENLPLDLLNRAQNKILSEDQWADTMASAQLAPVVGEERTYYLPTDMATLFFIFTDSDGDGKPDNYMYRQSRRNKGYEERDRFAIATGHSRVVTFYMEPTYAPRAFYQKRLADFTDVTTPQYSFFPGELLLRAAQVIHIEENGIVSAEVQILRSSYADELKKYREAHHNVNADLTMDLKDSQGYQVYLESADLQGNFSGVNFNRGYNNDVDLG